MRYFILLLPFLLIACASSPYKSFDKVKVGMDKGEVLELIGNPIYVNKKTADHIWIYRFYNADKEEIRREVKFSRGKVVYVGEVKNKPKIFNPRGSSYTEKDLEEYLKKEKQQSEAAPKKLDTHDMEMEMQRDLVDEDDFQPVD